MTITTLMEPLEPMAPAAVVFVLKPEQIAVARALAAKRGVNGASRRLQVAAGTFARAVAGLPIARGTLALLTQNIAAAEAEDRGGR